MNDKNITHHDYSDGCNCELCTGWRAKHPHHERGIPLACEKFGHSWGRHTGHCVRCGLPLAPPDPPSFLYRVVDKNGEQRVDLAFLAPTEADNVRVFYDEQEPLAGPFRVQRAQVHWEDVPE